MTHARKHAATVRIDDQTDAVLTKLSNENGEPKKEIVARAVERVRRDAILDAMNAGYANLRADAKAWAEEQADRKSWDVTLSDGLTDE